MKPANKGSTKSVSFTESSGTGTGERSIEISQVQISPMGNL